MNVRFSTALLSLILGVGCSTAGTLEGNLQPKLGATLSPDLKILARATATSDLTCQVFEAPVQPDGHFSLKGLCADTTYELKLTEPSLLPEGAMTVQGGPQEAPRDIAVWPAPAADGVAILGPDGKLTTASASNDVRKAALMGSGQEILYPRYKPTGASHVDDGSYLVIAGEKHISRLQLAPLVESLEEREFASVNIGPHWYVGTRFRSNTEVEAVTAPLDPGKITDVQGAGGRRVRYIAADALPPGHYALMGPDDARMYVITYGPFSAEASASN